MPMDRPVLIIIIAIITKDMFANGPARETRASFFLFWCAHRLSIGTEAQPSIQSLKMNETIGTITIPNGLRLMWTMGSSVISPSSFAVESPSLCATKP